MVAVVEKSKFVKGLRHFIVGKEQRILERVISHIDFYIPSCVVVH